MKNLIEIIKESLGTGIAKRKSKIVECKKIIIESYGEDEVLKGEVNNQGGKIRKVETSEQNMEWKLKEGAKIQEKAGGDRSII